MLPGVPVVTLSQRLNTRGEDLENNELFNDLCLNRGTKYSDFGSFTKQKIRGFLYRKINLKNHVVKYYWLIKPC